MNPTILENEDRKLGTMLAEGTLHSSHLYYHPGGNNLFMGYHPVLYFNPKVFNDLTNLAMAIEVTNRVHVFAWNRVRILTGVGLPPPGVPARRGAITLRWNFTPAYTQETVFKLEEAAIFYNQARYGPPVATARDRIYIPSAWLDEGPKFWMVAGGLISRLLCGLMFTSKMEREILFREYPQFWSVKECVDLELPCKAKRWGCDCGHHPEEQVKRGGGWRCLFCF